MQITFSPGLRLLLAALAAALAASAQPARADSDLRVTACVLFDDCYCHPTDGSVDPYEQVLLRIDFANLGDSPASGFEGRIRLMGGGEELFGFGHFGPLPTPIPAGGRYSLLASFYTTALCTEEVDIDITDLGSASSPGTYVAALETCDFVVGGGADDCSPCCRLEDVDPVRQVLATKSRDRPSDLDLTWTEDPAPSATSYNTWYVDGAANKREIPSARAGGPWPAVENCRIRHGTGCRHYDGVLGASGEVRFYQVRGLCGYEEAAE